MRARSTAAALGAVLLAGCAAPQAVPSAARSLAGGGWDLELPPGWRSWPREDGATASRLGRRLQRIEVRVLPLQAATPGGEPSANGTAAAAARAAHARLSQGRGDADVALLSAEEVTFAGVAGFRAELAFRERSGLRQRAVLICCEREHARYCLAYEAAEVRYYAAGLAEFESIAATFRLRSGPAISRGETPG